MIKTLARHGNSHALVVDRPTMAALGIAPETPLQVTVTGDSLVITRADVGLDPKSLEEHTREIRGRYGRVLKRLAE